MMRSLVPKLRFGEFSGEWESQTIGDVSKIKGRIGYRGYTVNDIVEKGKGAVTLSPSNFIDNRVDISKSTYISWFKYEESPEIKIKNSDILFVKTGSTYGKTAFVTDLNEKATINPQIVVFKDITINNKFLYYIIVNTSIKKQIEEVVVGGAIPTMSQKQLSKMKFLLPNISEQQKIANTLSSLDNHIEAQKKKVEALKKHKKGLMQHLFPREGEKEPRLRFEGFSGEWEEKRLDECSTFINEKVKLTDISLDNYISTENFLVDFRGVSKSSKLPNILNVTKFQENDVLMSNIRPYLKKIWLADFDGGASNDVIVTRAKEDNNYKFLLYIVQNDKFINYVMEGAKGVKMPRGDIVLIKKYPIFLPSPKEQQKIADALSSLDNLIEAQTQKIETLKQHKKGLMQQMFVSSEELA